MISRFSYDKPSISDTPIYDSLYLRSYLPDIHAPRFSRSESLNLISQRKKRKKRIIVSNQREKACSIVPDPEIIISNVTRIVTESCLKILFENGNRKMFPVSILVFFLFFFFFLRVQLTVGRERIRGEEQCAYRAAYKCGSRSPESAESF